MDKTVEKKQTSDIVRGKIIAKYKEYKLINGKQPASIFAFVKEQKLKEDQFFDHFSSFNDLEGDIWDEMILNVLEVIQKDDNYPQFTIREKLLTFYYTYLEVLKANRSFVLMELGTLQREKFRKDHSFLSSIKKDFGYS